MSEETRHRGAAARRRTRHPARNRRVVATVVGTVVVALVAVGGVLLLRSEGPPGSGSSPGEVSRRGGAAKLGVSPGKRAPDFALTTTEGRFRLSQNRSSTVVLDFLAPG